MDAFDADALIYAAVPDHALGRRVLALLPEEPAQKGGAPAGIGSLLLVPELLTKPTREEADNELVVLAAILGRLDLRPLDEATAELAVALGASYRLKAADAVHLATAVGAGADRFVTNNQRDFPKTIAEIDVTYLGDLPDPAETPSERHPACVEVALPEGERAGES
jgi:predicted nucleic acid-binding protein